MVSFKMLDIDCLLYTSIGELFLLSAIRASSIFIATRSTVILSRPPAWPTQITICGLKLYIFSSRMAEDSLNTVGKVTFLISIFFNLLGNLLIARLEGLILSPPKPVSYTHLRHCTLHLLRYLLQT